MNNWQRSKDAGIRLRNVRVSIKGLVVLLALLLFLLSYATWGYVGLLSAVAQWFASRPLLVRVSGFIFTTSLVALIVYGVFRYTGHSRLHKVKSFIILLLVLSIVGMIVGTIVSLERNPYRINVEEIPELISVFGIYRFIPMRTAYTNAISMLQIPTHTLYFGDSYVYFANDTLVYNWIIEPEGFWNQIIRGPDGIVFVDAGVYPPKVKILYRNMTWGLRNMKFMPGYMDSLYRNAQLVAGFDKKLLLEDNIEVVYNGKVYILVPAITWVTGLDYSLPILAGYVVVDENGNMEWVTPSKAKNDPRFDGVPLVPEIVAREWIEAYRWIYGIGNVLIYRNTFQIRDIGTNPQPYLVVDSKGNLWWAFVAEPPGETYSARYIFYVNTSKIEPHTYMHELPEPMIGVSKVEAYVKQRYPRYDWSQLSIEEPIPTIINNTLYWKVSITTRDGRGLVTICLVDAKTGEANCIQPRRKTTYMDILGLMLNKTIPISEINNVTLLGLVEQLKQRIKNLINQLEEIYSELEAIEERLNVTRGG